ncbi:MAG TPA: hypothetical protein VE258_16590, partial [Ktedonobacterales bacterium]|nr:hypothetical protein [Ktedonobacterales bacterium]
MFYRLGRTMVRLRYLVLACWAVAVLAALPFAPRAPGALSPGGFSSAEMESQRAVDALQAGLHTNFTTVLVIFTGTALTVDDPRFVAQASDAIAGLRGWPEV